jgi:hypothetical protein
MADTREPSPRSGRVFKGGKQQKNKGDKTKTPGEQLADSGEFLKDPETEVDTSKPLKIVDYKKDQQENKEFDDALDSVSPEGKYQKPPLKNLRKGVDIRNRTNLTIQALTGVAATGLTILKQLMINPLGGAM